MTKTIKTGALIGLALLLAACAGQPTNSMTANQCREDLQKAYQDLDYAQANNFESTMNYTQAMALLSAAKVQQEFNQFSSCIEKVKQARNYITMQGQ
ncbi:hypothetical protein [Piscirickettsia litoralis]|uniref:Lipoprotein n=1 Tax=Piscirickettsia litoralis TaxID=1891921 RepID=A0ABX3A7Q7_9GAMM|nr:hypothetical protein [Piscirickettsia litoralis]ODN42134.1 hypothetical protein BGC07_03200 [Piscirickettsia litoralis]